MKHYYHPMSRAVRTHWMLMELDVPHEQIIVDFHSGENDMPEFREINPMGKIPTLVDDGIVITETAAICAYLADKFPDKGMAPPLDSPQRGSYYRYLFFAGSVLEPILTLNQEGLTDYSAQSAGWGDLKRCMETVESMTPATDWAMGSQFTAADVIFGGTLDFGIQFGLIKSPTTKVANYVKRIKNRPIYRQAHDVSWH